MGLRAVWVREERKGRRQQDQCRCGLKVEDKDGCEDSERMFGVLLKTVWKGNKTRLWSNKAQKSDLKRETGSGKLKRGERSCRD